MEIIEKITSKDSTKVWSASCEIIKQVQDKRIITPQIPHLPHIIQSTKGLEMGGLLASNQRFVDYAIKTIEFHRDSKECTCNLYLGPESVMPDPNREQVSGYVKIIDTKLSEDQRIDFYKVECKRCRKLYKVIEREYHFVWWGWTKWED